MKEVLPQRCQNPPLDTVMTWIHLIILQTYFCNILFRITSSYAWFCQFISRIFASKKEEMTEGWKKHVIGSFIVCRQYEGD